MRSSSFPNLGLKGPGGCSIAAQPQYNNGTDCIKCFLTVGETVRKCCVMCKRGERKGIKKSHNKNNPIPLDRIHLPKPQMVKQVQVRRHQGNMKKKKKERLN